MPIYEYRCNPCGHEVEVFLQKFSDSPLTDCPKCGKTGLVKKISSTQFQLKGSGWYVTDFKDGGKSKKGTTPSTNQGSNEKSEKKPEDKSPPSSEE
jgi:putative FmdB family regulatory protein